MHDVRSLAIVVDKMLHARTDYLRTASDAARDEYNRLERVVRGMLQEILRNQQREMFDGD